MAEDKDILPPPIMTEGDYCNIYEARYWNCQGKNICIVASLTKSYSLEHPVIDWAAYIGSDSSATEREAIKYAKMYGCKLSETDAKYYFPYLAKYPYRR